MGLNRNHLTHLNLDEVVGSSIGAWGVGEVGFCVWKLKYYKHFGQGGQIDWFDLNSSFLLLTMDSRWSSAFQEVLKFSSSGSALLYPTESLPAAVGWRSLCRACLGLEALGTAFRGGSTQQLQTNTRCCCSSKGAVLRLQAQGRTSAAPGLHQPTWLLVWHHFAGIFFHKIGGILFWCFQFCLSQLIPGVTFFFLFIVFSSIFWSPNKIDTISRNVTDT